MNTHQALASNQPKEPRFLDIKFNQDQGCFAIGHEHGFHVYNTDPIDSRVQRDFNKAAQQTHSHQSSHHHQHHHNNNASASTGSGIGHITMLHRTNYLALVGGGKHPRFSNNKVVIWDDLKRKTSLTLEFLSPVLNVLLSRIRIIVVLQNQVLVYGFSSPPKKFATYETINNDLGIADLSVNSTTFPNAFASGPGAALSGGTPSPARGGSAAAAAAADIANLDGYDPSGGTIGASAAGSTTASSTGGAHNPSSAPAGVNGSSASISSLTSTSTSSTSSSSKLYTDRYQILAFPGRSVGQIQLVDVSPTGQEKNLVSIIKAHKTRIRCLTLNRSGTLIASASETGTIIRVHSTYNTALLYEFRRGLDRAIITSMKFSHNDTKLAVLSDKNTLHVFNVTSESAAAAAAAAADAQSSSSQNHHDQASIHSSSRPEHHQPVNRQHLLRRLPIPVPQYFKSTWSFCSVNINKYHTNDLFEADAYKNGGGGGAGAGSHDGAGHLNGGGASAAGSGRSSDSAAGDVGVMGWSGNDSIIIVWRNKRIWEKYVIVEKQSGDSASHWEIVRDSWKSLEEEST